MTVTQDEQLVLQTLRQLHDSYTDKQLVLQTVT